MERSGRSRSKRENKGRSKSPKVPIKTYRWEDVRRARRKGGYPWTYLYKGPFNEEVDAELFTMDHYRRTKSSSPMSGVEIHEVSTNDSEMSQMSGNLSVDISEPHEPELKKVQREGSFLIVELPCEEIKMEVKEESKRPDEVQLEKEKLTLSKESCVDSMGSVDSISQYLDKDERVPPITTSDDVLDEKNGADSAENNSPLNGERERAKSEEAGPRKRKLSAESSYSRISLSKLAVMKRLREAKDKIKVSKIGFPIKRGTKKKPSPPKETKKDSTKTHKEKNLTTKLTDEKPVYIHIPLKPPAEAADKFSHLENLDISNDKKLESAKISLDNTNIENENKENLKDTNKTDLENKASLTATNTDEKVTIEPKLVTKKPPLKINPAFKQFLKEVRQLKDNDSQGLLKDKDGEEKSVDKEDNKPKVVDTIPKTVEFKTNTKTVIDDKLDTKMDTDENVKTPTDDSKKDDSDIELDLSEQEMEEDEKEEDFDKLFEVKKERENIEVPSTSRNARSKSVEPPQRKRRSSMESSYSRKSLSRLGIIKKLNEAKEKIKSTLSLSNLFKKDSKDKKPKEDQKSTKEKEKNKTGKEEKHKKPKPGDLAKITKREPPKNVKPVYIHIPLKPPEGQTDEFSHLEFEPKEENAANKTSPIAEEHHKTPETTVTVLEETLSVGTPDSLTVTNDIQIIFLTPPSDDETLDEKTSDVPDTPSSDDVKFFSGKIGELKKLAQHVVDEISPSSKIHHLETVTEESPSERSSVNEEIILENKTEQIPDTTISKESEDITVKKTEVTPKEIDPSEKDKQMKDDAVPESTREQEDHTEKMLVDEEDGLNEPTSKHDDLKSSLKSNEATSPVMKKKVSFKRKNKVIKDTGDYEEIQSPSDNQPKETDKKEEGLTQSMSVDEEKTYLDQKIIKDTSLEEDYNKWSKKDDHEYEPVNPPEEVTVLPSALPTVKIIDTDIDPGPRVVLDVTKILEDTLPVVEASRKPMFHFHHSEEHLEQKNEEKAQESIPKQEAGPNKFQVAFKNKTDQLKQKTGQLKTRLQNVKKPQFHKPNIKKPDFKKLKIQKPNINLPKIPDTVQITLPFGLSKQKQTKHISSTTTTVSSKDSKPKFSFSSGKSSRSSFKDRQASTESNAGDEKKPVFGFSTFPKFMRKKAKPDEPTFATLPKQKKKPTRVGDEESQSTGAGSVRIPLHSEDSMESRNGEAINGIEDDAQDDREEDLRPELTQMTSPRNRYTEDADINEEFEKENREINRAENRSRWQHGSFKTDDNDILRYQLEQPEDEDFQFEYKHVERPMDRYDMERIRLEELENENNRIRYEEYFGNKRNELITDLDNLDDNNEGIKSQSQSKDGYSSEGSVSLHRRGMMGKLDVDSDEFFVVHEIHEGMKTPANTLLMNEYDPVGSNRSIPEAVAAKRKQQIKKPKRKKTPHVSQEQIPCDEGSVEDFPGMPPSRPKRRSKKRNKKREEEEEFVPYQETIPLEGEIHTNKRLEFPRESLGILGDDEDELDMYFNEKMIDKQQPDILVSDPYKQFEFERRLREIEQQVHRTPEAPPRRNRSLKSLTISENESISEITKRYMDDNESLDASNIEELIIPTTSFQQAPPKRPSRSSRSQGSSVSRGSLPPSSRDEESLLETDSYTLEGRVPCTEEPCSQDMRDYMGYAIVDKLKMPREPPLPPPRCNTGPRKKKQTKPDDKFSTVPRNHGSEFHQAPVRPLRNYSTLTQVQTSKSPEVTQEDSLYQNQERDKENLQIEGYEEIEDENTKTLHSEPVIQKMRERPLPAPPRPPRKPRTFRASLKDITSKENIMQENKENLPPSKRDETILEDTASTHTDPLPDNFVCEKVPVHQSDVVIDPSQPTTVRRELITPTHYTFEETVTHGSLLVEPINGAKILPDSQLIKERMVPIIRAEDDDEPSEPPESFKTLKNPETVQKCDTKDRSQEIQILKAEKLQVGDLDVDRLTVNQLLAGKIMVSEIETGSIKADDIQSASSHPFSSKDITLPPEFVEEIIRELQRRSETPHPPQETATPEEKKTPIKSRQNVLDDFTPPPAYSDVNSFKSHEQKQFSNVKNLDSSKLPTESSFTPEVKDEVVESNFRQHNEVEEQVVDSQDVENNGQPPDSQPNPKTNPPLVEENPKSVQQSDAGEDIMLEPPQRPPRQGRTREGSRSAEECSLSRQNSRSQMLEPEIDDQPPPRPAQLPEDYYLPSQPPASFYALRAEKFVEDLGQNIPTVPRRKRTHQRSRPLSRSKSTSEDSLSPPRAPRLQRHYSEPSIPELTGRLMVACGSHIQCSIKRLINHFNENVLRNVDGQQDMHICIIILLVLIAGIILLGQKEDKTIIHHHHWEYFNPPRDL